MVPRGELPTRRSRTPRARARSIVAHTTRLDERVRGAAPAAEPRAVHARDRLPVVEPPHEDARARDVVEGRAERAERRLDDVERERRLRTASRRAFFYTRRPRTTVGTDGSTA